MMIINNNNEKESAYPQCALQLSRGSLYSHSQLKKENRNMIVLKSIYVQKNKPNSTTTTTTTTRNNKQTNKKGLILTTSGQGRLDELVLYQFYE